MKRHNSGLIISLSVGLIISSFYYFDLINQFELSLGYDTSFFIRKNKVPHPKIKIIGIDQKSLDLVGEYPWRRSLYSHLLNYLGDQPKVIGFDIILPEHSLYAEDDIKLAEEIDKYNKVILPVSLEPDNQDSSKMNFIYPLEEFSKSAKAKGLIHYFPDSDGITRKTPKSISFSEQTDKNKEKINIFSYEIAKVYSDNKLNILPEELYCNFQFTEDNYNIYSFYDVVSKKIPAETFKDSIVLIGATAEGLQDRISSPVGPMYGVIYHAQLVSNILNNDYIVPISKNVGLFLIMFVSVFAYFIWRYFETINQLLLITISVLTLCMLHIVSFNENIWINIVSLIAANFITFISLILYEQAKVSLSLKFELDKLISAFGRKNLQYEVINSSKLSIDENVKSSTSRVTKIAEISSILTVERDFLEKLLNNISIPILVIDKTGYIVLANPTAEDFFDDDNTGENKIINKKLFDLSDKMPELKADLSDIYNNKKSLPLSLNYERGDAVYNVKLLNLDNKTNDLSMICMIEDVSNWHQMANKDGLTGLWNQRYFKDYLEKEINKSMRYKTPLSLIMMDVDFFKSFNDTYGHQTGDIVLKSISKVLQQSQRNTDIAARYGGEEFAIILTMTDEDGAYIFAERVRKEIERLIIYDINGNIVRQVTSSLGVAFYKSGSVSNFIEEADEALYLCKDNGRNCVIKFSDKANMIKNEL